MRLAKNDFGSVLQKRGFWFSFGFTKLTAVSFFWFCSLHYGIKLEMTTFCAKLELVQLIVSQSDSELEVHRYGMKKNTLTLDPVMLEDEL